MKIGICGYGFVGNAIGTFLSEKNYNVTIYDKYKEIGCFEVLLDTDIVFICLPTSYEEKLKTYNMMEIDKTLELLDKGGYSGIIVIKSTVLPNYCHNMNEMYPNLSIVANPEFLSAKTAVDDFRNQKHVVLGYTRYSRGTIRELELLYRELLGDVVITVVDANEAALIKLGCNSFYATKIQYFTELYMLCNKLGVSYENVKNGMLENGWINKNHTEVPGSDGKVSYGGMCFPKDIKALSGYMEDMCSINGVLKGVIEEREIIRKD
jgi:nucleotide sugar dehydrogenase